MVVATVAPRMKRYRHLDDLYLEHDLRKAAIRQRLTEFGSVLPDQYFYELVYCLLTPQSSAANAEQAVEALRAADFLHEDELNPADILRMKKHYVRFHNTKSRHAMQARLLLPEILEQLAPGNTRAPNDRAKSIRDWLVLHVGGLGWKESSHFLRNIGFRGLAILDRHILRNLQYHGVVRSLPKTLTPGRYVSIESRFETFANDVGIPMDELDLLFWSRETGEIRK